MSEMNREQALAAAGAEAERLQSIEDAKSARKIDTRNDFMVGAANDTIGFLLPLPRRINRPEALRLAAYIVVLLDESDDEFLDILSAIRST